MEQCVHLGKLTVAQLINKQMSCLLWKLEVHCCVHCALRSLHALISKRYQSFKAKLLTTGGSRSAGVDLRSLKIIESHTSQLRKNIPGNFSLLSCKHI
jgi:hypothetical protein